MRKVWKSDRVILVTNIEENKLNRYATRHNVILKTSLLILIILLLTSTPAAATPQVTTYIVPAITDTKILPATSISSTYIGDTIQINASPNQFASASFVIRSNETMNSTTIEVTNLTGEAGTITSDNIEIRVVKCWYQGGYDITSSILGRYLTPELLLKDDSLIEVEGENWSSYTLSNPDGKNYMKVNGSYIDISNNSTLGTEEIYTQISERPIQDAITLQPVILRQDLNKQFWVTIHIPDNTTAGTYTGTVEINNSGTRLGIINLNVTVLPIRLLDPTVEYSIYYIGQISDNGTISYKYKTVEQLTAEMQNMFNHGIMNPALYVSTSVQLNQIIPIQQQIGIVNTSFYTLGLNINHNSATITGVKNLIESYGLTDLYVYGFDEANLSDSETLAKIDAVHSIGCNVFCAQSVSLATNVAEYLDLAIVSGTPNQILSSLYHSYGHRVFSYANPQTFPEYPRTFRKNYGLILWQKDYDGVMDYAYQYQYCDIWNDFDHINGYRDHVFAYPTMNGVIDTIQYEGFMEGVNDMRYLATLQNKISIAQIQNLTTTEAENYLDTLKNTSLTTLDLDSIRNQFASYIISLDISTLRIILESPSTNPAYIYQDTSIRGACGYEGGISRIWTNTSLYPQIYTTNPFNFTNSTPMTNGKYYIKIYCNDTENNITETILQLIYDNQPPVVTLIRPANSSTLTEQKANFTFNVTDELSTIMSCSLYINNTLISTNTSTQNATTTTFQNIPIQNYLGQNWTVNCSDSINTHQPPAWIININDTSPVMLIQSPKENNTYFHYAPTIRGTCTSNVTLARIWTNTSEYGSTTTDNSFELTNTSPITERRYDIRISCNNTNRNQTSQIISFTYDSINPQIEYTNPTPDNATNITTNYFYTNTSTTDTTTPDNLTAFIDWNQSIVLWLRFDNTSGTFVRDYSSYSNDGTIYNMNPGIDNGTSDCSGWTTKGKFGNAINLDGTNDYIYINDDNSLDLTNKLSIEAWVNPKGFTYPRYTGIVWKQNYYDSGQASAYSLTSYWTNRKPTFFASTSDDNGQSATAATQMTLNEWQHIAVTYDSTHNETRFYINGNLDALRYSITGTINKTTAPVIIGKRQSWPFNGTIDEVKIWNRVLTEPEIKASYNTGLYRLEANFTNLTDGEYTYTAYVQDLAGNVNQTETRTITINSTQTITSDTTPDQTGDTNTGSSGSSSSGSSGGIILPLTTTPNDTNQTTPDNPITGNAINTNATPDNEDSKDNSTNLKWDAESLINEVRNLIEKYSTTKDIGNAESRLKEAISAYETGDYETSLILAQQAKELAEYAEEIYAEPSANNNQSSRYIIYAVSLLIIAIILITILKKRKPQTDAITQDILPITGNKETEPIEIQKRKLEEIRSYITQIMPIVATTGFETKLDEIEKNTTLAEQNIDNKELNIENNIENIILSLEILKKDMEDKGREK